jgi:hypothetical protein
MERDKKGRFIKGTNGDLFEGYGKWYDKFGYPFIFVDGKNILLHHFIWERYNGERPKGYHIHHIDGNKGNYDISNLQLVTPSDHQKIHAGWECDENGIWIKKPCKTCRQLLTLDLFYQRKGLTPSNNCKVCTGINSKKTRETSEEFREKKRQYLKEYYKKNKSKYVKQRKK